MSFTLIPKQVRQDFLLPWNHIHSNNSGQSLIEFIMTLSFSLGILFLFFSIAFNATDGYLIHYATFMASRTYAVVEINSNDSPGSDAMAASEARSVFAKYIDQSKGTFKVHDPDSAIGYPYIGVSFKFQQKFSFGLIGTKEKMDLTSESFLGREPTRATCFERICHSFLGVQGNCDVGRHLTIYDNGC